MVALSYGLSSEEKAGMIKINITEDGKWRIGEGDVTEIFTPADRKVEFIEMKNQTLCNIKSVLGYPALYPITPVKYEGSPLAVLMDLDGTSVHSEEFWMYIIERTIAQLMGKQGFQLENEDVPFVSGHSVSEHLQYCIDKYCPEKTVEAARDIYHEVTSQNMDAIMKGKGRENAFEPAPHLKEFLLELKGRGIKIGLVTSGLYVKAMPEIVSAFRTLDMGDPLEFYDAIITAGQAIIKGQAGTLGELAPKPHPWLYAECARVGLGISENDRHRVIGMEDSSAGVLSLRLAGFSCIGVEGGNIRQGGAESLCKHMVGDLMQALPWII